MISVPLDKNKHDRRRFDCGVEALNNYLRLMANQQSSKDNTRTFVLEDSIARGADKNSTPERIIGYYTLTMTAIDLSTLPERLQKKHQNAQAAGLIARLAIDKRYTKQGFGEWMLVDALKKLLLASDTVAFPLIIVDAKDGAIGFYEKFGFQPFSGLPNKLFVTVGDIRLNLSAK